MKTTFWRLLCMALLLGSSPLHAQSDSTPQLYRLTAREALDLAMKRRTEILNAQIDVQSQDALNREITGAALPQVKGNFGLQRNFAIPVTVLPDFISPSVYGVLEREDVRDGNGNPIKFDGVINTFPAAFGVPWQAQVGVGVQQLLFQPDVFIGLKARSSAIELYKNQLLVAEDSVKSNVLQTYYGVLVTEQGLRFARESRDRLAKLYADQQQLFNTGFIEKLDVEKTKVNLNNVNSTVTNLKNLVALSYGGLKFALGISQKDSLVLTDSLSLTELNRDVLEMENGFKYENRNEIKAINSSQELLGLQVRRYRMNAYPTVAAFWNLATNAQRLKFDFFDTKQRWFFSNIAGVNISVPLTDGLQRRYKLKQAELAYQKSNNSLDRFKQAIDLQVVAARTTFTNALLALNQQVENKELAEKVYATTKIKYDRGLGSSFELIQTETSLQDALNNYYQALYNAVVARIGYQRALGKL
ncbi:MAG: TolC family protein [Chitinophagaceae bacterium]|nr:TolC family protein [Chitinophagaceae bacterium]